MAVRAGWQPNIFPKTKSHCPTHKHPPELLSLCSSLASELLYVSLWLSCLVLQSIFHLPTNYLSLSHSCSTAVLTHSVAHSQHRQSTITLRKLQLLFLLSSPCSVSSTLSLCVYFLDLSLTPYLPFSLSITIARWQNLLPCIPPPGGNVSCAVLCVSHPAPSKRFSHSVDSEKLCVIKTDLTHLLYTYSCAISAQFQPLYLFLLFWQEK